MGEYDGKIVFNTGVNMQGLEKDLKKAEREVETAMKKVSSVEAKRMPLVEQSKQLGAALDAAKAKLEQMKSGNEFFTKDAISDQAARVKELQKEFDTTDKRVEKLDMDLASANAQLGKARDNAAGIKERIDKIPAGVRSMAEGVEAAQKGMDRFLTRVKRLAARVFVFTLITRAMRSLVEYMKKVLKSNSEASKAWAQLKGAMLAMIQPLMEVVIPALTKLITVLSKVVTAVAHVMASLTGKTLKQTAESAKNLYDEANALDKVGSAAKDAGEGLAGFDEINQIGSEDTGSSSSSTIAPTFDFEETLSPMDELITKLGIAAGLVGAMAAAFGKTGFGLGLVVSGAGLAVDGFKKLYTEGFTVENTLETISGLLLAGLGISVLTGSWIPLLIAAIGSVGIAILGLISKGDDLEGAWHRAKQRFLAGVQEAQRQMKKSSNELVEQVVDDVGEGASDAELALSGFKHWWADLMDELWGIWHRIYQRIVGGIQQLMMKTKSLIKTITNPFGGSSTGTATYAMKMPELNIPRLAQGAVIPPNKQFLSVLGDQKSGTNVEAPLETIKQALMEALQSAGGQDIVVQLNLDGRVLTKAVVKNINTMTQQAGRSVLMV